MKKRHYILFVSTDDKGAVTKVPVPMHYAYIFVAAAVIGLFTVTGLAGSYSRMLVKMSTSTRFGRTATLRAPTTLI